MELVEYRCQGTYRGKPCGKLLCRSTDKQYLEIRCDRCKTLNIFPQAVEKQPQMCYTEYRTKSLEN